MKIGILTLNLHTNYGGILQAYALQTVLEQMGHETVVFKYGGKGHKPFIILRYIYYIKRIIKKIFINPDTVICQEKKKNYDSSLINSNINNFISKYIHVKYIRNFTDLKPEDYDAIIVGSDQVWRPMYFKHQWNTNIENAFLQFTNGWNIRRIAYAASFGAAKWEYTDEETKKCKELLRFFDAVSVREDVAVSFCKTYLRADVQWVLDPTLLLEYNDYNKFCDPQNTKEDILVTYILDASSEKYGLCERIAREKKLKRIDLKKETKFDDTIETRILPSVEDWLQSFHDAKFVITDSFHACVFSIIFKKPFVVISNENRGNSRISSIVTMFSLQQNFLSLACEYNPDTDYRVPNNIDNILNENRIKSLTFLNKALTNNKNERITND